jgi:hypothetical protein
VIALACSSEIDDDPGMRVTENSSFAANEHPRSPAGNRILAPRDLVEHFKGTESWWIRKRPRMVRAGLLAKVGRKFAGDLSKIEAALADPAFWADDPEAAPAPGEPEPEVALSREPE